MDEEGGAKGGSAQCPVLCVKEPNMTGACSASGRSAAKTYLVLLVEQRLRSQHYVDTKLKAFVSSL
jgi:hypothetical protein